MLYQEERTADVCRKEAVKLLYCIVCDTRGFADARIEYKHIQTIADNGTHLLGELRSPIRSFQIGRDCICASTFLLDFGHE